MAATALSKDFFGFAIARIAVDSEMEYATQQRALGTTYGKSPQGKFFCMTSKKIEKINI